MAVSLESSSAEGAGKTSPPSVIARAIVAAATARRPRTRYRVGFGSRPFILLSRLLPARTFDTVINRAIGVPA